MSQGPIYVTRVTNEITGVDGGMRRVTPEFLVGSGFSPAELAEIARLPVDGLWVSRKRNDDRSIRRVR